MDKENEECIYIFQPLKNNEIMRVMSSGGVGSKDAARFILKLIDV